MRPFIAANSGCALKKSLDLDEVVRRDDEIIVETYDYVALGLADRVVLDSAFAGTRIVQML